MVLALLVTLVNATNMPMKVAWLMKLVIHTGLLRAPARLSATIALTGALSGKPLRSLMLFYLSVMLCLLNMLQDTTSLNLATIPGSCLQTWSKR